MGIKPVNTEKDNIIQSRNNLEQVPGGDIWMESTSGGTNDTLEKDVLCLKVEGRRDLGWGSP
jgi:hypothetical protein